MQRTTGATVYSEMQLLMPKLQFPRETVTVLSRNQRAYILPAAKWRGKKKKKKIIRPKKNPALLAKKRIFLKKENPQ